MGRLRGLLIDFYELVNTLLTLFGAILESRIKVNNVVLPDAEC
jgi:hypothetical protein